LGWLVNLTDGAEQIILPGMADPTTTFVAEIMMRLAEREFRPFSILLSDGSRHHVPTPEHCTVTRLLRRIELEYDGLTMVHINPLHITRLETAHKPAA
jgi:hypothetical protein